MNDSSLQIKSICTKSSRTLIKRMHVSINNLGIVVICLCQLDSLCVGQSSTSVNSDVSGTTATNVQEEKVQTLPVKYYVTGLFQNVGGKIAICSTGGGLPSSAFEKLCFVPTWSVRTDSPFGELPRKVIPVNALSSLQNRVHIASPGAAIGFVRLRTSPFYAHCFESPNGSFDMEITTSKSEFLSLAFGNHELIGANFLKPSYAGEGYFGYVSEKIAQSAGIKKTKIKPISGGYEVTHNFVTYIRGGQYFLKRETLRVMRNGMISVVSIESKKSKGVNWNIPRGM